MLVGSTLMDRYVHAKEMRAQHETLLADLATSLGQLKVEVSSNLNAEPASQNL